MAYTITSPRRRALLEWGLLFLLWNLVGLAFVANYYAFALSNNRPFTLEQALWMHFGWYIWIPLTPLVARLARRWPVERARWVRGVAWHVGMATFLSAAEVGFYALLHLGIARLQAASEFVGLVPYFLNTLLRSYFFDLLIYLFIAAVVHALESERKYRDREVRLANLETQLAEAQLNSLRMQLNPHFLFNTLHTISAIMDENVRTARRLMADLSDLLRLSLDNMRAPLVPLRQELDFVVRYLGIEQERFQERLSVQMEIAPDVGEALVPNLILQPLVENAIKHGIAPFAAGGSLLIRAYRHQEMLVLQVEDDGPGLPVSSGREVRLPRHGVGLRTTEERLAHLYGENSTLDLTNREEGGLRVTLSLPFCTEVIESLTEL
jgi:signal transduction histidine kinase